MIDRFWFKSVYFLEPGGVLFELATEGPGFARRRGRGAPRRVAGPATLARTAARGDCRQPAVAQPAGTNVEADARGVIRYSGCLEGESRWRTRCPSASSARARSAPAWPFRPCTPGVTQALLLHDLRVAVAEGEAMDLADGGPFYPPAAVRQRRLDALLSTDALVIAAGRNGRPGESRLDLLRDNVVVVRQLGAAPPRLPGRRDCRLEPGGRADLRAGPRRRGCRTNACSAPGRCSIRRGCGMRSARRWRSIRARSMPRSWANMATPKWHSGPPRLPAASLFGEWPSWTPALEEQLTASVRTAAYEIIKRKGVTNHAIGLVTAALLKAVLRGEDRVLTVSRVQDGAAGLRDVALSLPAVVGAGGAVAGPDAGHERRRAAATRALGGDPARGADRVGLTPRQPRSIRNTRTLRGVM